jgi:hypothetical protein
LINPPYAEAMKADNTSGWEKWDSKSNVASNKVAAYMMNDYWSATRELFTQFIARIAHEIPNVTLAILVS